MYALVFMGHRSSQVQRKVGLLCGVCFTSSDITIGFHKTNNFAPSAKVNSPVLHILIKYDKMHAEEIVCIVDSIATSFSQSNSIRMQNGWLAT